MSSPTDRSAISKCYLVGGNLARIFSTFTRNSEQRHIALNKHATFISSDFISNSDRFPAKV